MIKHSMFATLVFVLLMTLSGCMTHPDTYYFEVDPISHSFKTDVPLHVGLVLTDEFKNASWTWEEHKINFHIGGVFSEKAKEESTAVFSDVVVVDNKQAVATGDVNALLIPQLISFEKTRPVFGPKNQICTAIFKWTLTDMNDSLIWIDTMTVECESPMSIGTARAVLALNPFPALKRGSDRQMELLAEDFFNKSVKAMKSSVEIMEFAKAANLINR